MGNIIPTLYLIAANATADKLACDVQERLNKMFCREMYYRRIGKDWQSSYGRRMDLLNINWLLQYNPSIAFVDVMNCWYRNVY